MTGGTVTLDGTDIRELALHELREEIGFVPQKGVLFSGTIASNLHFGRRRASDEELKEAARIAQASDFIEEKEEKYDSPIAQGGSNVSGGQKQRLAIARAIAKNPQIYIFDDSFSALDLKTDAALRKALAEKVSDKTVLIVPKRISTILHADQILVLNDGRIVGRGHTRSCLAAARRIGRSQNRSCPQRNWDWRKVRCRTMSNEKERTHSRQTHHHGPMGGHGMGHVEKAKDFKGSIGKLTAYMGRYKIAIFIVMIFAASSTVFGVVGPVWAKRRRRSPRDWWKKYAAQALFSLPISGMCFCLCLPCICAARYFPFIQLGQSQDTQKICYRMRREISEKINRMPMKYFESRTYGEVLSRITNDVDTLGQG